MNAIAPEITGKLDPWARKVLERLPPNRRRTVLGFMQALIDDKVGGRTLESYICSLRTLNGEKPYQRLTEKDIRAWAEEINVRYEPKSAWIYTFNVKRFLKWVHTGSLNGDGYPSSVGWIKKPRLRKTYGREVLTPPEVKLLVDATHTQRDRALLFVAYESGARAGELVSIQIKDISFDQYGAVLRIGREQGKTGERRVRLFESVPDLQLWLSMHPDKDNPESPLWPGSKGRSIHRRTLLGLVWKYARKAGLGKMSPHSFRHARATHLANVLKEAAMREYFGWSKDSDMPSVYVHLSGRDVDQALFEHYGIKERENGKEDSALKKRVCPRCKAPNSVSARFCWRCWGAFDAAQADELTAQALDVLMKMVDPAQFREKLKEKGIVGEIEKLVRGKKHAG